MKLTLVALFTCIYSLFAADVMSQSAKVSIHANSSTVQKVIKQIEKQTDYLFVYDKNDVDIKREVSMNVNDAAVSEVLNNLFAGTNVSYKVIDKNITLTVNRTNTAEEVMSTTNTKQIGFRITGKVSDLAGEPIIGANILEKGTTNGTITDVNGNFELNVQSNAILIVSYIGYATQEVKVTGNTINITMKDDTEALDEVVVVGYGTQKKVNLSGSVATADTKKLTNRPVTNVASALQGAVANLNIDQISGDPNDIPSFNVRGYTSINGGSPMIVIDGVVSDATLLNHLNPADIENVSILKDAASAAIYGSRAAYGVILVTTKTSKQDKIVIDYNNEFSFRHVTIKPNILRDSWVYWNDWRQCNGGGFPTQEILDAAKAYMADDSNPDGVYYAPYAEYFYVRHEDHWKDVYKSSAFSQNHNVSISGRSDKVNYYVSGNYQYQDGLLKFGDFGFNQYNVRAKLSIQATDWLNFGSNTSFVSDYVKGSSSYYVYGMNDSMYRLTNAFCWPTQTSDGHWVDFMDALGDLEDGGRAKKNDYTFNQLFTTKINIWKDYLTFNGSYNFSLQKVNLDYNRLTWDLYDGPGLFDCVMNEDSQGAYSNHGTVRQISWEGYLAFNKIFSKKHEVNVIMGVNQEAYRYTQQNVSKLKLISESVPSINLTYGTPTITESVQTWATRGLFGRLNYVYNNRYIGEFNFRNDGSSRFPHDSRMAFNPSGSVAWVISQENFWQPLNVVWNYFKFRASLGTLGNQDLGGLGTYPYIATMRAARTSNILNGIQPQVVYAPGLVSANLTWEKVTTYDIGVDLGFFNNRLTIDADLYRRNTKGMLTVGQELPIVLGAKVPNENAADLKTVGWEITASWREQFTLAGKPFMYNLSANLSDAKAKITKFANPTKTLTSFYKGMEIGEIWGLVSNGLYATDDEAQAGPDQTEILDLPTRFPAAAGELKYIDQNGDNKITIGKRTLEDHGDLVKIGNSAIRYRFGITLGAQWNNFDLTAFFQGVMKHMYAPINDGAFWGWYLGQGGFPDNYGNYYDRWRDDNQNPNAYFPKLRNANASKWYGYRELYIPNSRYLQNAAYIRLKNLSLGYTIQGKFLKGLGIQKLRIYYSGENLFTNTGLYKYYKVDPENLGNYKYPLQTSNSFGVNVTL